MTERHRLADVGFHDGELAVQRRAGVRSEAGRLIRMLEAGELSAGIAGFLAQRSFLVITGRDRCGVLWTSPLLGSPGFLEVRSETELAVHAVIPPGDPLHELAAGQKLGLTTVEFATRRRVRINGTLTATAGDRLTIEVEQAYGNCPQYIQQRLLEPSQDSGRDRAGARLATALADDDIRLIRSADTFFLGTVNPERGADASHRGGAPGFVRVDERGVRWPDYPGNNLFNSLGNLAVNPEAALLFFDFTTGRTLHLSGTAKTEWGQAGRPGDDGHTGRVVRFAPERLVAGHLLPARETASAAYPHQPAISD